jgi:DNA modification methylase
MKNYSKEEVEEIFSNENLFIKNFNSLTDRERTSFLRKVGKVNTQFKNYDIFITSYKSESENLRFEIVKTLSKITDINLLPFYKKIIYTEKVSDIRREIVSAIGRLRSKKTIQILIDLLKDDDPNVVLQAMRGLLVFKEDPLALKELKKLNSHPNEIVKLVIENELVSSVVTQSDNHAEVDVKLKNKIVKGDSLNILKKINNNTFHLTFTSPPYYNARDYSIYKSYDEYLKFLEKIFKEIHRTTKEGRFFILNTSPVIVPRFSRNYSSKRYPIPFDIHPLLINMGWEFIDDIVWSKPEASAKNRVGGFLQHKKPLAYKPNATTEMVMVYRKKTNKLIDWNLKQYTEEVVNESLVNDEIHKSNLWNIGPSHDKVHSAVFPKELCDRIIKYYSLSGDLVLDPFAGSGTFGNAALERNRSFFLIEKDDTYYQDMKKRFNLDNQNNVEFIESF